MLVTSRQGRQRQSLARNSIMQCQKGSRQGNDPEYPAARTSLLIRYICCSIMVSTRKTNKKQKFSALRKVQSRRIGHSLPDTSNSTRRNVGKELFPQLSQPLSVPSVQETRPGQPSNQKFSNATTVPAHSANQPRSQQHEPSQTFKRRPLNVAGRRTAYLKEHNNKLRLLKVSTDGIAKRQLAL